MEAVITEEKISSDVENNLTTKDKLNESGTSHDEFKTDAMLDEVAARVDALDFNGTTDEPESAESKAMKQGEIIKKQAETINTLISQLRIMFDEYNDAVNEKGYYEDLSEALLRYIEICEGKIELEESDENTEEENTTPTNSEGKEDEIEDSQCEDKPVIDDDINDARDSGDSNQQQPEQEAREEVEEKATISNSELIRLNHILLREIIELRNERDVLRSNIHEYLMSEDDDDDCSSDDDEGQDSATDEENHRCEHCSEPAVMVDSKNENDEEYENKADEQEMIENESDTE